jgi:hypothetical protein
VKRMLVLSLAMIALALGAVWVASSVGNTRDRSVPGHATGSGKILLLNRGDVPVRLRETWRRVVGTTSLECRRSACVAYPSGGSRSSGS